MIKFSIKSLLIILLCCPVFFAQAKPKIAIGIVVDNSASMRSQLDSVVDLGKRVASEAINRGCTSMSTYRTATSAKNGNLEAFLSSECSRDRTLLSDVFDDLYIPSGGTMLVDAIGLSARSLVKQNAADRTVLILISDGWDRDDNDRSSQLFTDLKAEHLKVFAIALPDALPRGNSFSAYNRSTAFLQKLTSASGGEIVSFHRGDSPEKVVKALFAKIDGN